MNYELKKCTTNKTFFVFNPILMKFGTHMSTTTSPSFIKIGIEIKKVLLIAHFIYS